MHVHSLELSVGLSFLLGIFHALEPGHGKTAMYLYMLEGRRSLWHPLVMGISTAISHATSLIVIALLVHLGMHVLAGDEHAGHQHAGEALQWISVALIMGLGVLMLWRALRHPQKACGCSAHRHAAGHSCDHPSVPALAGTEPQLIFIQKPASNVLLRETPAKPLVAASSLRMTVLMGIAVGLLPCPTALAAYFAGVSSGNPLDGYLVLAVFSCGIALSLAVCGILLQALGGWFSRRPQSRVSARQWGILRASLILMVAFVYMYRAWVH